MALSIGTVCLPRSTLRFIYFETKFKSLYQFKSFKRHLRGSRLGKSLSKEEIKFQNLLKTLKDETKKPVAYNCGNIPVGEVSSLPSQQLDTSKVIENTIQNLNKILEKKITPLKEISPNIQLQKKFLKSLSLLRVLGQRLCLMKVPIALDKDNLPCPVELTIPSPDVESYRNQDEFSIGISSEENKKKVGFFMESPSDSSKVVCINPDELIIFKESHKNLRKDFENYLQNSPLDACVRIDDGGYWKGIKIRSNLADELMAIISMNPQNLSKEEVDQEKEKLLQYFLQIEKSYNLKSLYFHTCHDQKSKEKQDSLDLIFGESFIQEELKEMKFQISPNSYFPSNTKAMQCAYDSLLKVCRVKKSTTILDLFCGTGTFSLTVSPFVQKCIGIDNCSSSIKDARINASINSQNNVEFFGGDVEYLLGEILEKNYTEDLVVVINPSRTELTKTALKILRSCKHLKKIVFITTKPKIALEQFTRLCKPAGSEHYLGKYFVPILAVPVDLFPQTDHYGLIVMFQRL